MVSLNAEAFLDEARNRISDAQDMIRLAMALQKPYYDTKYTPLTEYKVGDYACL